ncbi:MAG: TfoX/Sxy family protein [Alphaproteobacteria bacterium]|nr:TfoX/Sxy family protein [Alphaproteobacteria bacterium]
MAYDEFTARRVRNALPSNLDVKEIKMMGGLVFMVNGNMCCGVVGKDLMVRIGPEAYRSALTEPHVRPMEIGGGRKPRAFIRVEPDGHETEQQLAAWLTRGIKFVSSLPPGKPAG